MALYGVQFAGYLLPLLTIPYLARVLKPEEFGYVAFAQSFALWASLIVEYGFNLSATRDVARLRKDKEELSGIVSQVNGAKLMLVIVLLFTTLPSVWVIPMFKQKPDYFFWAFFYIVALGFSPFWYFQGTEKMVGAVFVEFSLRFLSTVAVFLIVKVPDDGWKVMALQALSGLFVTAITISWIYRQIPWRWINLKSSFLTLRRGWSMFIFRTASSLYITAGILILGLFKSPAIVGYYSGADRIYRAAVGFLLPLSQAVYPRINLLLENDRKQAVWWIRSTLVATGGIATGISLTVVATAPYLVSAIFGPGYESTVPALRILAAVLPLTAINTVLGGQWLLPNRLEKASGRVILYAGALNIFFTVCLIPKLSHIGVAWALMISEIAVFIGFAAILRIRNLSPLSSLSRL